MAFYHGAETNVVDVGLRPVRQTQVGVIGLVGTSPQYLVDPEFRSVNRPIQVLNKRQAVQFFGSDRVGYTIPQALNAIFDQVDSSGGVVVVVINVLNKEGEEGTGTEVIEGDEFEIVDDEINLGGTVTNVFIYAPSNSIGLPPLIFEEDVDYTIDLETGVVTVLAGSNLALQETVFIDYTRTFSSEGNTEVVTSVSLNFTAQNTIELPEGVFDVVVTNSAQTVTYSLNIDYLLNEATGLLTRLNTGAIPSNATIKVSYRVYAPSTVATSQIIGEVTEDGERTGLQAFLNCFNEFGFSPKIIIAPGYSSSNAVTTAMDQVATALDCMAVVDAPLGLNYNQVIAGRGPNGAINFNYSSNRLVGCYPHLKAFRGVTNQEELEPMSPRLAGVWANRIVSRGFWWSPSNVEFKGITGTELPLEFVPGRLDTEANQLNANGIVTYINYFGNGIRSWGNRSFAFPNSTNPDNFINVKFAQIVINERIKFFAMQYVDYPINDGLIDAILDSINAYLRSLINQGGLLDGSRVYYDPSDNPPQQIADGQLVFRVEMLPSPPAERITFLSYLNVGLANSLNIGRQPVGG